MRRAAASACLLVLALLGSPGCSGAERREEPEVRVFTEAPGARYAPIEEIDTVVNGGGLALRSPLERATDMARLEARSVGGDCVILAERSEEVVVLHLLYPAHIHLRRCHFRWIVGRLETVEPAPPPEPPAPVSP